MIVPSSSTFSASSLEALWLWVILFTHIRLWILLTEFSELLSRSYHYLLVLTGTSNLTFPPKWVHYLHTHTIPNLFYSPAHTNIYMCTQSANSQGCKLVLLSFLPDSLESISQIFLSPSSPLFSYHWGLRSSCKMTLVSSNLSPAFSPALLQTILCYHRYLFVSRKKSD